MRSFIAILAAACLLAEPALSEPTACGGCNGMVPLQGTYDINGPATLRITHIDGSDDLCPTRIRVEVEPNPGAGQAITGANLTCDAGAYVGQDFAAFRGVHAQWRVVPQRTHTPHSKRYAGGVSETSLLDVAVAPPANMMGPQTGTRRFQAMATASARAADCICSDVFDQIQFQQDMIFAQSHMNKVLKELKRRGNLEFPEIACAGGDIVNIPSGKTYSAGRAETIGAGTGLDCKGPQGLDTYNQALIDIVNRMRGNGNGGSGAKAAAGTNPSDCAVGDADIPQCVPQAYWDAAYEHEVVHSEQCTRMNNSPELKEHTKALRRRLSRLTTWKWTSGDDPLAFLTPSYLYFNNPVNAGRFESEAYRKSLDVLNDYAVRFCDGAP